MKLHFVFLVVLLKCVIGYEDKPIPQYLSEAGGFAFMSQVIAASNLTNFLEGTGPFTVFAPNDGAFAKLGMATLNSYLNTPVLLETIAEYHILQEYLFAPLITGPTNKTSYEGQHLALDSINGKLVVNGNSHVVSEIVVRNGIILVVDTVLNPPVLPTPPTNTIFQLILQNNNFTSLNLAILLANMSDVFGGGEITVFAPDNAAFVPYLHTLPNPEAPSEYYAVRRSDRRSKTDLEAEKLKDLQHKILNGVEDGLEVKDIPNKGRGVVATKAFNRGDFVVVYAGDRINMTEAKQRDDKYSKDPTKGCYMYYFNFKNKNYCIDATEESGKLGRLLNHSKTAGNCHTKLVDVNSLPYLILVASRDIAVGEELQYDYGDRSKAALESHPWLKS